MSDIIKSIEKIISLMNEMKEKKIIKDYAIGGAVAVIKWTEPFLTQDIDIFITLKEKADEIILLSPIYDYLKKKGYSKWKGHWVLIEDIPVDILPADELIEEAITNAEETKIQNTKTKIITPEYLIAIALRTGRAKDLAKVEKLLEQAEINKAKLKQILKKYDIKFEKINFENVL